MQDEEKCGTPLVSKSLPVENLAIVNHSFFKGKDKFKCLFRWNEVRFSIPYNLATSFMRLFIISWLPKLNRLLLILYGSYRLIICIGISINLIWNGTPVFCRFDTIQGEPPNIVIFSVVKFLISISRPITKYKQLSCQFQIGIVQFRGRGLKFIFG